MKRFFLLSAAAAAVAMGVYSSALGSGGAQLRAGAAKIDITPPASMLKPGDSIRDQLYARAVVLRRAKECAVLVSFDQVMGRDEIVKPAIRRASRLIGCPTSSFVVSATHTHSGTTSDLPGGTSKDKEIEDGLVRAITAANSVLRPVRVGYGTTTLDLNVNRDLFINQRWIQGPNREGRSDKTLSVLAFIGDDDLPVAFYFNYAMHPINYYLSGVVSADYPGEAARYIEQRYNGNAVALFGQGASGDQNPNLLAPAFKLSGVRSRMPFKSDERFGQLPPWIQSSQRLNSNAEAVQQLDIPISNTEAASYKAAVDLAGRMTEAMGTLMGEKVIDVFKNQMRITNALPRLVSDQTRFTCPGRDRVDLTARQGVLPSYRDGDPVNIEVGVLQIADISIFRVNGEVYSDIWKHLQDKLNGKQALMVTLANGAANTSYIYSDEASPRLTFQVIGSRLKPGCAEAAIIAAATRLSAGDNSSQPDK